jgi:hypothetical protein
MQERALADGTASIAGAGPESARRGLLFDRGLAGLPLRRLGGVGYGRARHSPEAGSGIGEFVPASRAVLEQQGKEMGRIPKQEGARATADAIATNDKLQRAMAGADQKACAKAGVTRRGSCAR